MKLAKETTVRHCITARQISWGERDKIVMISPLQSAAVLASGRATLKRNTE